MIPQATAAYLQIAMQNGNASAEFFTEIRLKLPSGACEQHFYPVSGYRECAAFGIAQRDRGDVYVSINPRGSRSGKGEAVTGGQSLYADCDSTASVEALRRFCPPPSYMLETSPGRRAALWALRERITPEHFERANKRLIRALGADRAPFDRARVTRLAGTVNHKRATPTPVHCVGVECVSYALPEVVGGLSDLEEPTTPRRHPSLHVAGPSDATLAGILRTVAQAQEGNRNASVFWAACRLAEHGLAEHVDALREAALTTGLDEREIDRTIASAFDRKAAA